MNLTPLDRTTIARPLARPIVSPGPAMTWKCHLKAGARN